MKGFQITFFTQQDKRHGGRPLGEWLLQLARELDLPGATLIAGSEGFGQRRHMHSARFFELADQPQEVQLVVSDDQAQALFARLQLEGVHLFYVRTPVEFGTLGGPAA